MKMLLKSIQKVLRITIKTVPRQCYSQDNSPKALRSLKAKSTRNTVQYYVDSCSVRAVAGNGGDGCISFLSVWCKDQAGPDGGDGGHGGHVIFKATHTVKSLNHVRAVIRAANGGRGDNKDRAGKNADHVIVPVPLGTIIKDHRGVVVGDLSVEGRLFVGARGGAGGRGNRFFLTDTEQAPSVAELGAVGETVHYWASVRSLAHVGLAGEPNAGKSTLLRALTRARPAVAAYPFTTRTPHVGMIPYDDYEQVALADLPGLIAGSHKNYGLGIQFLQHVERCRGLIYLLDGSTNPLRQLQTLTQELCHYSRHLANRPSCVVVNKIDLPEGRRGFEEVRQSLADAENTGRSYSNVRQTAENNGRRVRDLGEEEQTMADSCNEIENNGRSVNNVAQVADGVVDIKMGQRVIGISAKTGINLGEVLKVIRELYDQGEDNEIKEKLQN